MEKKKNILRGIVLAGGQSKRFGKNKALAEMNGETLLEKSLSLLKSLHLDVAVITSSSLSYDFLECPVITDRFPDKGPLGGLYTAFEEFSSTVLVMTCDMPMLTKHALKSLIQAYQNKQCSATIFDIKEDYFQPFPGIYEYSLFTKTKKQLKTNQLSMQNFLEQVSHKQCIDMDAGEEIFLNINTQKDLSNLKEK